MDAAKVKPLDAIAQPALFSIPETLERNLLFYG